MDRLENAKRMQKLAEELRNKERPARVVEVEKPAPAPKRKNKKEEVVEEATPAIEE